MRRIVIFDRVSADGYFAGTDGDLDWVVPEDEIDRAAEQGMPGVDTLLFGRKTYDVFESFWSQALDDGASALDPHAPGRRSPSMHAMAVFLDGVRKIVFSTTRRDATWRNTHLRRAFDPREIAELKRQPGGDVMVFGSGSIASALFEHGLVDGLMLVVTPVVLGSGRSLVREVPVRTPLRLRDAKTHPSGNLTLSYEVRARS